VDAGITPEIERSGRLDLCLVRRWMSTRPRLVVLLALMLSVVGVKGSDPAVRFGNHAEIGSDPVSGPCSAQVQGTDEQRRLLDVRRRQIDLRAARSELRRSQELFAEGLLSRAALDTAEAAVQTAQLSYQEAVLSLLNLQPRLSVREAVKYQAADGRRFVRLTVENLTPTFDDSQFKLLNNFEGADPIPEELRRRDIRDIFISLKDSGRADTATAEQAVRGTTIALPYEVHIPSLGYGDSKTLQFQLLRDVNTVVVASAYKGQTQEIDIHLQQAETTNVVGITSTQASQEADLASQATFDLRLERSSVDVRQFQLRVVNLPKQIAYSFLDPSTQARLSQVSFQAGVNAQPLGLRLFLPERSDDQVRIDQPLEFWALVMTDAQADAFRADRLYTASEIQASRVGQVRLAIMPRGVGKIEVSAPSLFSEIQTGESVQTTMVLRNTGTRRIDNTKLSTDAPLNWRVEVTPNIVPALEINRETPIQLRIVPPADVPVGDYEVRVKSESYAYNRQVPSEDKIYRVSVKARANLWATLGLVAALAALILGIIYGGMKLTRR
jgi:hypothetical protein